MTLAVKVKVSMTTINRYHTLKHKRAEGIFEEWFALIMTESDKNLTGSKDHLGLRCVWRTHTLGFGFL